MEANVSALVTQALPKQSFIKWQFSLTIQGAFCGQFLPHRKLKLTFLDDMVDKSMSNLLN